METGSYSMNNDNIGDDEDDNNTNLKQNSQAWGTWEDLLLACAVKRHGFSNWDSVAMEVRSRSSISAVFVSADNCRQKYRDLKRRFQKSGGGHTAVVEEDRGGEERNGNNIPWLEQLRSLRVAELRREVQRYDVSILSLQLKVKKLEEERGDQKPDLEDERKEERSDNDVSKSEHRKEAVSEADHENRSMNESNSTTSGGKGTGEDERVDEVKPSQIQEYSDDVNLNPDPVYKSEAAEEGPISRGSEASHSNELGESGTSVRKFKRKRRKLSGGSKSDNGGDDDIRFSDSKSQPLIGLLNLIRSHPRGSLFERRLRSQETKDYKSFVKQHLDIETIQTKLKQGTYDSSSLSFYKDLQLLFTNAIVFFPSSSSESMAAHELRTIVFEQMRKETGKSGPRLIKSEAETSDSSSHERQKSPVPLVVCKRKRFATAKASTSSSSFSHKEEKENNVRSSKVVAAAVIADITKSDKGKNKQKQTNSSNDNGRKKETENKVFSSDKKKSMADFLKRLKKNSPEKESKSKTRELRSNNVGKKKAELENTPAKKTPGTRQKKTVDATAERSVTASGKRSRESGSTGKDNKKPKKRSRR